MNGSTFKIRLMQADDFDAVIGIDEKVLEASRPQYYKMKFDMDHLRELGVQKIHTLVDWNDAKLVQFFRANEFIPSQTINLERRL